MKKLLIATLFAVFTLSANAQTEEVVDSGFHVLDAFNESEINYILGLIDSKKYIDAKKMKIILNPAKMISPS